ncbi:MAG: 3' terminal RNA ribose 2'-O-methyltransferase Hen1, partial [bacterium]|nr:3' terminal RNA ribose 2'-O-methyltransferase Hen1 [bacterium]
MLLTVSTTHQPATDLGYLLHKHPDRVQSEELPFGKAHTFYPEATVERCTAALLLDIDPIALARGSRRSKSHGPSLYDYVNDRPYVASSFLSVAIARAWGTALSGKSADHAELAGTAIPVEVRLSAVPCRGGEEFLRRLFEPLGYEVRANGHVLDEAFPEWGESRYYDVELRGAKRLGEVLTHIYVLIPVLDGRKHYWVSAPEVEKLLRKGEGWLGSHPERDVIARRYLGHQRSLARAVLARLLQDEEPEDTPATDKEEDTLEKPLSLSDQRIGAILAAVRNSGATSVVDLGCGEGKLLRTLVRERHLHRIVGLDISIRALETAASRLKL